MKKIDPKELTLKKALGALELKNLKGKGKGKGKESKLGTTDGGFVEETLLKVELLFEEMMW